jgi:hypothetical protein
MLVFAAEAKGPLKVPGYIDYDDVTTIKVYWGAPVFATETVYREGDICRPTVDNGYYYSCTTNGKAAATEPTTWGQVTQTSGTAKFEAVPYDLFVLPGEQLSTLDVDRPASAWVASDLVTIGNATNDFVSTTIEVQAIPDGVTSFTLTNHVVKGDGQEREKSFTYKVRDQ